MQCQVDQESFVHIDDDSDDVDGVDVGNVDCSGFDNMDNPISSRRQKFVEAQIMDSSLAIQELESDLSRQKLKDVLCEDNNNFISEIDHLLGSLQVWKTRNDCNAVLFDKNGIIDDGDENDDEKFIPPILQDKELLGTIHLEESKLEDELFEMNMKLESARKAADQLELITQTTRYDNYNNFLPETVIGLGSFTDDTWIEKVKKIESEERERALSSRRFSSSACIDVNDLETDMEILEAQMRDYNNELDAILSLTQDKSDFKK